jgi:hypothetical protein
MWPSSGRTRLWVRRTSGRRVFRGAAASARQGCVDCVSESKLRLRPGRAVGDTMPRRQAGTIEFTTRSTERLAKAQIKQLKEYVGASVRGTGGYRQHCADRAMYAAKQAGHDHWRLADLLN